MDPPQHPMSGTHLDLVVGSLDMSMTNTSPLTRFPTLSTIPTSLVWCPIFCLFSASWAECLIYLSWFWLIAPMFHTSVYQMLCMLGKWFSKCGFRTTSNSITWKYVRSTYYTASPQNHWLRNSGGRRSFPTICVLTVFQVILLMLKFENNHYRKFTKFL